MLYHAVLGYAMLYGMLCYVYVVILYCGTPLYVMVLIPCLQIGLAYFHPHANSNQRGFFFYLNETKHYLNEPNAVYK